MPATTPIADGGPVETTITSDPASGAQTLHIQKVDAAGHPVGAEFDATQHSPHLLVQVTALPDGVYAVGCGYEFRGWNYQVSVFGADGTSLSTFSLNGYGEGLVMAASNEGGFLLADRATVTTAGGTACDGAPLLTLYDSSDMPSEPPRSSRATCRP